MPELKSIPTTVSFSNSLVITDDSNNDDNDHNNNDNNNDNVFFFQQLTILKRFRLRFHIVSP